MEFFLITCAVMAAVIVGIHKMTDYLGFEMKWRPLALCAVMAVAANLVTLLVSAYITFDYVALIVILIIVSAALMTYYNEYLLKRDLEWEPEETALEKVEAKLESVAAGSNRQIAVEVPESDELSASGAAGAPETERIVPVALPVVDVKLPDLTPAAEFPPEPAASAASPVPEPIVDRETASEPEPIAEPETAFDRSPEAVAKPEPGTVSAPEPERPPGAVSSESGPERQTIAPPPPEANKGVFVIGPNGFNFVPPEERETQESLAEQAAASAAVPERSPVPQRPPISKPEPEPVQSPDISEEKLSGLSTLDDFLDYAYSEKGEGNLAAAAAALTTAVEKFGDDGYAPFIVIELANVYKAQGDYQAAIQACRNACRLPAVARDEITLAQFKGSEEYLLKLLAVLEKHGTPQLPFTEIPEDYFREIL